MRSTLFAVVLIVVAVAVLHGRSIGYGLMLDDHNHRAELREGDWSLRSLVEASHLGGERRRVRMWWQDQADQIFFRPLAFLVMRAEYVLTGWRAAAMHVFSLAWTAAAGVLVMFLARRLGLGGFWPVLAGLLFVAHPANALTTQWIACQNEQMATVFLLAGLLAYARYAGWRWNEASARSGGLGSLLIAAGAFVAAMLCRETGLVFLPLVVIGDVLLGPVGRRDRVSIYAALVVLIAGYLVVRHVLLGPLTLLGPPYAYLPSTPGFVRFVIDKLVYYLLGLFAFVPIVGFAGLEEVRAQPVAFYGSFGVLVVAWAVVIAWLGPLRRVWFALGLAVVPLIPVLPVFSSSHHLFLGSAGSMLAVLLVAAHLWRLVGGYVARRVARVMIAVALAVYGAAGVGLSAVTTASLAGFHALSELPAVDAVRFGDSLKAGDRLFFIHLPPLGFNCLPAIEEAAGAAPLRAYVLTFSPDFLGVNPPAWVERAGADRLRVWTEAPGFFAGLMGRSMLQAVGRDEPFAAGQRFTTPDFDVEIVRADRHGVQELHFTFRQPLDEPTYHFFVGSSWFKAYPVRFASSPTATGVP